MDGDSKQIMDVEIISVESQGTRVLYLYREVGTYDFKSFPI